MTILWAGGEDTSWSASAGLSFNTSSNAYRSAFARTSFVISNSSTAYPPSSYCRSHVFTPSSTIWAHVRLFNGSTPGTTLNCPLMSLESSGQVGRIMVVGTGTSGQLRIVKRDAAGTLTTLVTSAAGVVPPVANTFQVEFDLFVNYAVSGQATLYINGVNVADTGPGVDVTTNSVTTLNQILFSSMNSGGFGTYSEAAVADATTLGIGVQTLPPLAAGNTQSWTPNTVGNVNPSAAVDANFISAASANALSEWTLSTTLPTGSWAIRAYVQEARALVGTTGPLHFEWLLRTVDGSDNVSGSVAPLTSFGNFQNVWSNNPHTSAAWGSGELINAGIESLT